MSQPSHLKAFFCKLFCTKPHTTIAERVEKVDRQNREVRHDLKNIQARTDALRALVERMRADDTWNNESGQRRNVQ